MRRQRVLVLILVTLFAFSLIDLSGHGEPTDSLLPTSNPSDWNGIADDGISYFGTGSPLTVTFSGTFTNSSSWSEVDTTLSSEFAPGTSFVVTNASTVTWSAYILVSPPAEVESLGLMVDYFGTEWKPTSLTNPVGTSMSYPSQWWYDADMVYVSESAVTTYGVWKLDFTAMNHLSDLQLGEVGASLGSSATFDISDEMLFRGTSSWIAGATTEFALTDPTGATWHTATNSTPGSSTHVLQSFRYKKDITVDRSRHLSTSLTNFPVMVRLVDTDLHDKVQADGDDIAFYAGGKIVPHEIELFDQDFTGTEALLIAWVKVNLTGSANTVISMYYGNPYLGPQERPDEVWTQNFGAVWHLNEDTTAGGTSAIHYDSTSNNHFGNQSGNEDDTGQIGLGQRFDGSNDQIVISSDRNFAPSGDVEISGWFKLDSSFGSSSPTTRLIFTKYLDGDNDMHIALAGQDYDRAGIPTGSLVFKVENNAAGQKYKYTTRTSWTAGTWYHFSCFVDSDTPENNEIWINGSDNTGGTNGSLSSADVAYDADWGIGGGLIEQVSGLLSYFDGVIDEVRVSTTIRGQAWKSASYSNQLNPSSFYSVGSEQERISPGLSIKKTVESSVLAGLWTVSAFYNDSGSSVDHRVGFYERQFIVRRASSVDISAPLGAVGGGVASLTVNDILYVEVDLEDSVTSAPITGATVTMNWSVGGVPTQRTLSDLGGGKYGRALNTSNLGDNKRWRMEIDATHPFYTDASTQFDLDLFHDTRLDYSEVTTTPVGFDTTAVLTFRDDYDGTKIVGATITYSDGSPVTILSQANGVYEISIPTAALAQGQYAYIVNATKPGALVEMGSANITVTIRPHYTSVSVIGNLETPVGEDTLLTVVLTDMDTGTAVDISDVTSLTFASSYGSQVESAFAATLSTSTWTVAPTSVTLTVLMSSSDYYAPTPYVFEVDIRKHYTAIGVTGGLVTPYGNVTPLTITIIDLDTGASVGAGVVDTFTFTSSYDPYSETDPSDLFLELTTGNWIAGAHPVTLSLAMEGTSDYFDPDDYAFSVTIRALSTVLYNTPNDLVFPNGEDMVVYLQFNVSEPGPYFGDPIDAGAGWFVVTNATYTYPATVIGLGQGLYELTIDASFFFDGDYTILITVSPLNPHYARTTMTLSFNYRPARSDLTSNLYTVSTAYRFNVTVTLSYIDLDRSAGILTGTITSPDTWVSFTPAGGGDYEVEIGVYSLSIGSHPINLTAQAPGYDTRSIIITVIVTRIHTDAEPSLVSLDMPVGSTREFYIDLIDLDNSEAIPSVTPTDDWAGSTPISVVWNGSLYVVTFTTTGSDSLGIYTVTFTFSPGPNYFDASCEIEVDVRTHTTIFTLVSAVEPTPFNGIVNISLRYYDFDDKVGITDDSNIDVEIWNGTDWISSTLVNEAGGFYTVQIDASLFGQGLQSFEVYFNWVGPVQQFEDKMVTASVSIIGIDSQLTLLAASEPTPYLGDMHYEFFYSEVSGLGITNSSYGGGNVHISVSFQGESVNLGQVSITEIDPVLQPGEYSISFSTTLFGRTGLIYMNVYINWSAGVAPFYTNRFDVISVRILPRDTLVSIVPPVPTAYGEEATLSFSYDDVTGGGSVPIDDDPSLTVLLSIGDYDLTFNPGTHLFTVTFNTSQFGAPLGEKSFTLGVTWAGVPYYANRTGRVVFITVTARQTVLDFQSPAPTSYLDNVTITITWTDVTGASSKGIAGATVELYDLDAPGFIPVAYYTVSYISDGEYQVVFNTSYYVSPSTYNLRADLSTGDFYIQNVASTRSFNVRYRLTILSAEPIGLAPYNSTLEYTLNFQDLDTLETITSDGGEVTITILDAGWTYTIDWLPGPEQYLLTVETYDQVGLLIGVEYSINIRATYAFQSPFYASDDAIVYFELRTRQSDLVVDDPPDPTAYLEDAVFRVRYYDVDSGDGIIADDFSILKGATPLTPGSDYTVTDQGNGFYLIAVNSSSLDGLGLNPLTINALWNPAQSPYHDDAAVDVSIFVTRREANVEITVPAPQTRFLDDVVFTFVYRDLRSGAAIDSITTTDVAIWADGTLLTPVVEYSIVQDGSSFSVSINSATLSAGLVSNYNVTVRVDWNDGTAPYYIDDSTIVRVTTTNRRMSYSALAVEEAAYGETLNLSFSVTDADSGAAVVLVDGNIGFDGQTVSLTEGVDFTIDFSQAALGVYTIRIDTLALGLPNTYLFDLYVTWTPGSSPYYLDLTQVDPIEMTGIVGKIDTELVHIGPDPETADWDGADIGITVEFRNSVFGNTTSGATVTWAWPAAGVEFGPAGEPLGDGVYIANINPSLADAGTHIITVRATGLAAYKDAVVYVTLVVAAAQSEITDVIPVEPVRIVDRGASLNITIKVADGSGLAINDSYVNVVTATVGPESSVFVLTYTGTPGYYTVTLPEDDATATRRAPGSYSIYLIASLRNYEPATYSFKIQVLQSRTEVRLTGDTTSDISRTFTENVTVYVQVVLPDLGEAPFENTTVQWLVADTEFEGNFTHLGNGNFSAVIYTEEIGFGIWTVIFRATPFTNASLYASSQTTISFAIKRIQTSTIVPSLLDYYWGWTGYLEFRYWDDTFDRGVEDADVQIEISGLETSVIEAGNGTYLVFFNTSLLRAGESYLPVTVSFNKANYQPSNPVINVRVREVPTDIFVSSVDYTPIYIGDVEDFAALDTVDLQIPLGDLVVIDFFFNDTEGSDGFMGGLEGAVETIESRIRGPSIGTFVNVNVTPLGNGLYRAVFDTTAPEINAIISSEPYRLYIEMALANRSTTDILFRIEVIDVPTELTIVNEPSEWTITNGEPFEIELYYYDAWHGVGVPGAALSANTSAGAPFTTEVREGADPGQYFVSIGSKGVMFNPSSGTLTIRIGVETYEVGSEDILLTVLQSGTDQVLTNAVVYGLPASLFVILILGLYVKVWSVPKRIRQINGQIKAIRKGKQPKPVEEVKSRQELIAGLFNDTYQKMEITRTPEQMPEESVPIEVPELGELLVQLAILTNLNAEELEEFKSDISKMKISEQAAFVKEVIMQEAIRAARRDGKTVDETLAEVERAALRRIGGEEEAAAEEAARPVERVFLGEERDEEAETLERREMAPDGEEVPSDEKMSPYEIEELQRELIRRGVPAYEIDTIMKQAETLPKELVEDLVRALETDEE